MQTVVSFDNLNLNDRVYMYLRDKIIKNELKPGARINYEDLIQELGVSRTPLRDALNLLQQQGLVEVKPRSGSFVTTPNVKDIEEIYDVRKALECQALLLAAKNMSKECVSKLMAETEAAETSIKNGNVDPFFEADRHLHQTILNYSHNRRLIMIMDNLAWQIKWFGVLTTCNFERPLQANQHHKKILKTLYDGKISKAIQYLGEHIDEIKQYMITDFS